MVGIYADLPVETQGYEFIQPLITAKNGGAAAPIRYTGLKNDAGYGATFSNTDGIEQLQIQGSDGLARLEVDDNETRINTLSITGNLSVGNDATINNDLHVLGSTLLGDDASDTTQVFSDFSVGRDVDIQRNLEVLGDAALATVHVTPPNPGNDQAIFFRHNALGTATYASIGATNSATPAVVVKNQLGTQIATFGNDGVTLIGSLAAPIAASGFSDGDIYVHRTYFHSTTNWRYAENPAGVWGLSHNGGGTYDLTIDAAGDARFLHSVDVDVALNVDGTTRLRSSLQVDGTTAFNGAVSTDTGIDLDVGGAITAEGSITNNGNTIFGNASGDSHAYNGSLTVSNGFTVTAGGLAVTGGTNSDTYNASGTGTVLTLSGSSQTQSTVGGAGGASALPATPRGYMKIVVGGNSRVIAYYDP